MAWNIVYFFYFQDGIQLYQRITRCLLVEVHYFSGVVLKIKFPVIFNITYEAHSTCMQDSTIKNHAFVIKSTKIPTSARMRNAFIIGYSLPTCFDRSSGYHQSKFSSYICIFVVCFILGDSLASEFYMPMFRNTLFHPQRRL